MSKWDKYLENLKAQNDFFKVKFNVWRELEIFYDV